jgi:exodeoxyribonuclease VII large subunit
MTVSELTARIRDVLEGEFSFCAVVGEISNAKVYPSGHWYFSLKDKDATISCVCFKNANAGLKFELEDGLMVVARGKLSVYPPRGNYQLVVSSIEPVGIGEWQLAFEQLRQKLELDGLLDPTRKRALPILPRKVGVVTSLAGAALRDILSALRRRNQFVSVVISPTKVQGEGSPEEIVQAIHYLEALPDIEVILIARGGGSIEDLWSFNTEIVARAVANCSIPTISGVGHETDVTICDLVADLRAPTPTAAAELVAKGSAELIERFINLNKHILANLQRRLSEARLRVSRANPYQSLLRLEQKLQHLSKELVTIKSGLTKGIYAQVQAKKMHLEQVRQKFLALGPNKTLSRGFSIVQKPDGQLIRSYSEVKVGDTLEILLAQGKLTVKVESSEEKKWPAP